MLVMGLFSRLGRDLTQIPQITQIHTSGIFLITRILGGIRRPITQIRHPDGASPDGL
jgi:hypothetical protein